MKVVEEGSFSKAEETGHISKQAILRQINALEEEVGVRLLCRTSAGITLTKAGEIFSRGAEELLYLREKVLSDCRALSDEGECVRVSQVEYQTLLSEVTDAFSLRYPDIPIKRVIHPNRRSKYRVEHDIIDVGQTLYGRGIANLRACAYARLTDLPFVAVLHPDHPLAAFKQVSLQDLADYTVVFFRQLVPPAYIKELRKAFEGRKGRLESRTDAENQVQTAVECVSGQGIFFTSNPFVHSVPQLRVIPLDTGWSQEYGLLYRTPTSPAVQKYVDLALSMFGKKRPQKIK